LFAVNAVGVDLNTASASLLSRVSGLSASLADAIIVHRDQKGAFNCRRDISGVARLGPRAFELCAGFLRIPNGSEPLDASSVHPEAYGLARKIVAACSCDVRSLMGDVATLKSLDPSQFADERFGLPTVRDILPGLERHQGRRRTSRCGCSLETAQSRESTGGDNASGYDALMIGTFRRLRSPARPAAPIPAATPPDGFDIAIVCRHEMVAGRDCGQRIGHS
jgi:Helix-hairpin-helix motif/HHH domain